MPIGYDYRCTYCAHEWTLFSRQFALGPVQWGSTRYTCFSCQTFLAVPVSVDSNSWAVWLRNHQGAVHSNAVTAELAQLIHDRLANQRGLTPIDLDFGSIRCPMCGDSMSMMPFEGHLMNCPQCGQCAGESVGGEEINIYAFPDAEGGTKKTDAP